MKKINLFFRTADTWLVILIFTVASFALSLTIPVFELCGIPNIHFNPAPDELDMGFLEMFIFAVILAPLIETLVFQLLPFWLLSKIRWLRENPIWIVIIPSVLFGISHNYSIHYMVLAFFAGAMFMYVYIIRSKKHPFITVATIHALSNLLSIVGDEYYTNLIS